MLMYEIWSLGRKPFENISGHEVRVFSGVVKKCIHGCAGHDEQCLSHGPHGCTE